MLAATTILPLLGIVLYTFSLYGWGVMTLRVTGRAPGEYPAAYTIALGVAALICLGGLLNMAGIAYTGVLLAILTMGWVVGFYVVASAIHNAGAEDGLVKRATRSLSQRPWEALSLLLIGVVAVFLVATLLPSANFNFHDDYHTYFPRITVMLATGTLGNNPFGLIGVDSLGAQQFMQSLIVSVAGFKYVNGFDAVLGVILSCALVIQLARQVGAHWVLGLSGAMVVVLLNTQQVNISSVYSTTLLAIAFASTAAYAARESADTTAGRVLQLFPLLLVCSALIALKLISAIFASLLFILFILTPDSSHKGTLAQRLRIFIAAGASLTLLTAPWFLVHRTNYWQALKLQFDAEESAAAGSADDASNLDLLSFEQFFSGQELFWGGTYFGYNTLFILLGAVFVFLLAKSALGQLSREHRVALALTGATVIAYALGLLLFEPSMALRYSAPFLVASVAATPVLLFTQAPEDGVELAEAQRPNRPGWVSIACIAALQSLLLYSFSDSFTRRVDVTRQNASPVMFPLNDAYRQYMDITLSPRRATGYAKMQELCTPGTGVFAWVSTPFLLDYERNDISNFADPAVLTPWFGLPTSGDTVAFRDALLELGIECIIMEYQGFGMKSVRNHQRASKSNIEIHRNLAQEVLALRGALEALGNVAEIKYHKDGLVIMDISRPTPN